MPNKLPREIARGVFWIGDCLAQRHKGKIYHGYNAAFLIAGESASCLVEEPAGLTSADDRGARTQQRVKKVQTAAG